MMVQIKHSGIIFKFIPLKAALLLKIIKDLVELHS